MSVKDKQNEVFAFLREAKLEIKREDVNGLIQELPHLPLPKGGHPLSISLGLNLKSIIMNSILFISLLSTILYFSQGEKQKIENTKQETHIQIVQGGETEEMDMEEVAVKEPQAKQQEREARSAQGLGSEASRAAADLANPAQLSEGNVGTVELGISASAARLEKIEMPNELELASKGKPIKNTEGFRRSFKGTFFYNHRSPVSLNEEQTRNLRQELRKQLKEDAFSSKKSSLVIHYKASGIEIANEKIGLSQLSPYEAILKRYGVTPGPRRQIHLIEDKILIGDFDTEGEMRIGILEGKGQHILARLESPAMDTSDGALFPEKEGGLFSQVAIPCEKPLKFKGNLKLLRRKLKGLLSSDDLMKAKKGETRLWFPKEGIAVNDQLIPQSSQNAYYELMEEFNITPCASRIIQFTTKYFAVGDIKNGRFGGRIDGAFDLDDLNNIKLKESIAE